MSTIPQPEALAAKALRDWLLRQLPTACATINALRAAVLTTPLVSPFTIPADAVLKLSLSSVRDGFTSVALTSGSRTAAQVVSEINAALGATVATANDAGQVVLTSTTAPTFSGITPTNSSVAVGPDTTGANLALGFDAGGEWQVTTPLLPPTPQGVCDGFPVGGFFMPAAIGYGRVLVTIGERTATLKDGSMRRDEHEVVLDVSVFRSEPQQQVNQSREGIQAALRAVRACLTTDAGKQLGRASPGDIVRCRQLDSRVAPGSFQQVRPGDTKPSGLMFDAAELKLQVLVFENPPIT